MEYCVNLFDLSYRGITRYVWFTRFVLCSMNHDNWKGERKKHSTYCNTSYSILFCFLSLLMIFYEGAYLTFKLIKTLDLFKFVCETHARIRSCIKPVLSNEGKVSCSRKQWEPLIGLELATDIVRVKSATYCATPHAICSLI